MTRRFSFLSVAAALTATCLLAQGPGRHMDGPGDFALLHAEFGVSNKVVQGAPYSATATTQFTQTLANGDHIQRSETASIARDSQGRTRTDRSVAHVGALSADAGAHSRAIVIHDPVAAMSYALDPSTKTARSMAIPTHAAGADATARADPAHAHPNEKVEDLGTQVLQSLNVQGKRVTRIIPAGREGNEKEIDTVTETWYSPDLQVVVMSKTSDPRFGESTYQLSTVTRAEPDPTLFVVPSDYAVTQGHPMGRRGPGPQ